ncbi:sensor histidine kinase [Pseudobacillus wudalianchiensis]|uniref:histidine kinase n=1 Tax=Pseudobacillus wudalianchiensis TaxID=1743143 RepID=A0A1B9B7P4_9BACI|nr:HAMP domain-containing sensor histidine kinase [Bacillus wudalianchiensis]OCA92108.1 two-component sensor histidine kinase [Bacillus wudalianchiensis]
MREDYIYINKKLYYSTVLAVIIMMVAGLLIDNPQLERVSAGYFFHFILVIVASVCLLLYPKYLTRSFRIILTIVASVYFYTLFFLYPDTWSTFIFLCFVPAVAILFFDAKIFYFSLLLNNVCIILIFVYIGLFDQGYLQVYLKRDLIGNVINFIGSQAIICFIFYISYGRIEKQQLYYEQIQQAERLKTTGQLAAAVAHEIRNPLTVVKGFLQLYEKNILPSDQSQKRHFSLMIEELNTAEEVVSQLLSIAKPSKDTEVEIVDVRAALQSVTELLHSYGLLNENKIEINKVEACYIAANNMEIKQLLVNIIKNAIEASKTGDSVTLTAKRKKDFVEIKVMDQGRGMSAEEIKSLGTPFYSLKSKGTGLGMMICYNIAAKYKGSIDFQSSKDKGTTVTISFPEQKL